MKDHVRIPPYTVIEPHGSKLAELAPNVVFTVSREVDPHFVWDGDGPDPSENGFEACDVDVKAKAILQGKFVVGSDSLGGSYFEPGEENGDVHGYLLDMLERAAQELLRNVWVAGLQGSDLGLANVLQYLKTARLAECAHNAAKGAL